MDMTDPHAAAPDEDPERHIGQEIPDPWGAESAPAPLRVAGPAGDEPFIGTAPIPDPPLLAEAREAAAVGWFEENKPAPSEDPRDSWPGY